MDHVVSEEGVATDPDQVSAIDNYWPTPWNMHDLKAFMGTVGYYHQYIEKFATIIY